MTEQVSDNTIGPVVPDWTPRSHPLSNTQYNTLQGQYCRLELLNSKTNDIIIQQLYDAFKPTEETHFKYLKYGPFKSVDEFKGFVHIYEQPSMNTVLYTIFVNEIAVGFLSYLRISPEHGTIEIGHINFSQQLVRTRQGTEAIFLLMQHAFDTLGYRRVEWKCNSFNIKSRQAAIRLGFQYDGTWLKSEVCKGRSRDNSWYSIIDDEWIKLKPEFQRWLNLENFDGNGQQLTKLTTATLNPRLKKIIDVN